MGIVRQVLGRWCALTHGRRRFASALQPTVRALLLAVLAGVCLSSFAAVAAAQSLTISNVGAPTVVGSGQGKRAIWTNAGMVGAQPVDIVARLDTATLDHDFTTQGNRPSITSVGQDNIWTTWRLFEAGTYDINTDSGGVPVVADIHIQLNDIDGPNNERAYLPTCSGSIEFVRIQEDATTDRDFGTVMGRAGTFSLIGDQNYNSEPQSGVEALYPSASSFEFGRTADNGYFVRVDNPTYAAFNTYDFQCGDFEAPVAVDDSQAMVAGPNSISILDNDSVATNNPGGTPSEWALQAVSLTAPPGATGVVTDADGHVTGFTVPGEGSWSQDDTTGILTFTPDPGFGGSPTPISYIFYSALQPPVASNAATVTLTAPIIANDDAAGPVTGSTGNASAVNAFANDTLGGVALDPADIAASVITPAADPKVSLDTATGIVSVAASTPAGVYTIVYEICEVTLPGNCDQATITVTVSAAVIDAVDDSPAPVDGVAGDANLINAFTNDTLGGAAVNPADISASIVTPASHPNVALDTATGVVSVVPNTPSATYTITYEICENLNPANCDQATITVTVSPSTIDAVDEAPPVVDVGIGNPNLIDAFANDTLNGASANPALITATVITPAADPGVALDTVTGNVSVGAAVPVGTYTITYEICDNLNPATCDTAVITVVVTSGLIDAVDDAPPAVGATGNANLANVLGNDSLNGVQATTSNVTLSVVTPAADPGVALDTATGVVSVATGTPAGTYTIDYQICAVSDPANCDTATVTVQVVIAPIVANDDTVATPVDTMNAVNNAVDVLANDQLSGAAPSFLLVNITAVGPVPAGFFLQADGTVDIAQHTPSGVYSFTYQICEAADPANCDTAVVTIPVNKSVPAISGTVYFDANGNGSLDAGERHLPGYTVELRQNGVLVQTTTSATDGSYHFQDFPPDTGYAIVFIDPATGVAVGSIDDLAFGPGTELTQQNQPIDPSGVFYNSETGAPLAGVRVELRTSGNVALPAACLLAGQQGQVTGVTGNYRFDVVAGAAAQCPAGRTEYRLAVISYPSGIKPGVSTVAPPHSGALDAGTCPDDAVPGGACQLSTSSDAPSPGAPTPYYLIFLLAAGDPNVINNHIPLDPPPNLNGLTITKRANVSVVRRDEAVSYVIAVTNPNGVRAGPLDIHDRLPAGFAFVPGSASVDDAPATPEGSGRDLSFPGLTIPAGASLEIRLTVRVGADVTPGEQVNQAWVTDPATGQGLTAIARAAVRVLAEHVFDCGEIIGKVFNDLNRDGAQDEGEKGLPGVRVVTVNGILITTDRHGRFSVPCAEVPDQAIGSNFILKLDTRTLPDGFKVTTENPRVVRLTAGKLTKLNFGAAASNVIDIAISGRAFEKGSARPSHALASGIGRLGDIMDKPGSSLRVVYDASGESQALARRRVQNVQALIADVWQEDGRALPFDLRVVGGE